MKIAIVTDAWHPQISGVTTLTETIRLMAEIDQVIDANGGWPDAFQPADKTEE